MECPIQEIMGPDTSGGRAGKTYKIKQLFSSNEGYI